MNTIIEQFKGYLERRKRPIKVYASSMIKRDDTLFFLIRKRHVKKLVIISPTGKTSRLVDDFTIEETWEFDADDGTFSCRICPCNHQNASVLRERFPFTKPRVIGLTPAIGTGDRIGLATPGHIRAVSKFAVFPVLAQQSIREMTRTCRSPEEVVDDVSWWVFQEGYQGGFAADADHLKTVEDIDVTFRAGFTMYTLDPSEYVDDKADEYDLKTLRFKFEDLPWTDLKCEGEDLYEIYLSRTFELPLMKENNSLRLTFSEEDLLRAAVKYSAAIAHVFRLKRHLDELFNGEEYDLEVSVDETESPTSPLEHLFIALELKRLDIYIQGLALRFVGRFEKAIDYIGDLEEFKKTFRVHVAIVKKFGPYKLSVHSGSDKFSIYPVIGKIAGDMIHLKTAGTTYLESLRIVARRSPDLFREIVQYSLKHFEDDRKTYHISTKVSALPSPDCVADEDLERIFLEDRNGRQLLHVTFGSVLTAKTSDHNWLFRERIKAVLFDNEEEYYETVSDHIGRHIKAVWFT